MNLSHSRPEPRVTVSQHRLVALSQPSVAVTLLAFVVLPSTIKDSEAHRDYTQSESANIDAVPKNIIRPDSTGQYAVTARSLLLTHPWLDT